MIVGGIVAVIVLALLVVLAVRLIGDDGESTGAGGSTPSVTAPSSADPTDQPSADPTNQPSSGVGDGTLAVLGPGEVATVVGGTGESEVEVALMGVERNWQPEGSQAVVCPDPEGEYIALEFEFTTLPALADGAGSYSFAGFEVGLANDRGTALDASGVAGLFCLSTDQRAPSEVAPGETFTGWAVVDAPAEASHVLWEPFLSFSEQPTYAWSLADF